MGVIVLGPNHAKDASAQDYLFTDKWPVIDLNPEDWREVEQCRANENGHDPDHRTERN